MSTLTLTIITATIALVQLLIEEFFKKYKPAIKATRALSLILVLSAFYSAYLTAIEGQTHEKEMQFLNKELAEEKDKIKSIAVQVKVKLSGSWPDGEAPYSNHTILRPFQDTVVLSLLPGPETKRGQLLFYPTRPYTYFDTEPGVIVFDATLSLHGDADILSANRSEILKFHKYHFSIPLEYWHKYPRPLVVKNIEMEMRINDVHQYSLKKEYNHTVTPEPEPITKDSSIGYYLHQSVTFKDEELKYTLLKK